MTPPLIANPNPLVVTIEYHEATGATRYHANRESNLLQQFSIFAQLQRSLIDSTPGARDPIFLILRQLFLTVEELLKVPLDRINNPPHNPAANPGNNGKDAPQGT